jgi:hypothetical protein
MRDVRWMHLRHMHCCRRMTSPPKGRQSSRDLVQEHELFRERDLGMNVEKCGYKIALKLYLKI